jgi:hypothetical protein
MELLMVESIRNKLDESKSLYEAQNKKYYRDVLDFLNLMFEDNTDCITKLKFKKITLNSDVFELYNQIIKKYDLNKPEFQSENFNIDDMDDPIQIKELFCTIAFKLSNFLLERLRYKLKKRTNKDDGKIKFFLEYDK